MKKTRTSLDEGPGVVAPSEAHWYAVHTRSRHEKRVRDQLLHRNVEVFLPLCEQWNHWKDRIKRVELPLFPGYCFARFAPDARRLVLAAFGVVSLVGINGHSEPVPDAEVDGIRRLVASRFHYDPHPFLEQGMEVEVVRGPLAGVRGRLVRKDRSTRLVIAVTLIRQAAIVEVHPADVARV
jgi:transcriptional antiterminator NusG